MNVFLISLKYLKKYIQCDNVLDYEQSDISRY